MVEEIVKGTTGVYLHPDEAHERVMCNVFIASSSLP